MLTSEHFTKGLTRKFPHQSRSLIAALPALLLCVLCSASHNRLADWHMHHRRRAPSYLQHGQSSACLTYEQRYESALKQRSPRASVREEAPVAVIIRFFATEKVKDDLVTSLRVLTFETERRGYHAYIFFELKSEHDDPEKEEAMRGLLPEDLRRHVVFWRESVVLQTYPSLPAESWQWGYIGHSVWGSGPTAAYLPLIIFMQEHSSYDFAWVLEDDVRYIGDWGDFFRSAYVVAGTSLDDLNRGPNFRRDLQNGFASVSALGANISQSVPDFITFAKLYTDSLKWAETAQGLKQPYADTFAMVWGGSRELFQAMDLVSSEGAYSYYEMFMPTVALMSNLTVVGLPLTGETFDCCNTAAEHVYRDWYLGKHNCHQYELLHAIKLSDAAGEVVSPPWTASW